MQPDKDRPIKNKMLICFCLCLSIFGKWFASMSFYCSAVFMYSQYLPLNSFQHSLFSALNIWLWFRIWFMVLHYYIYSICYILLSYLGHHAYSTNTFKEGNQLNLSVLCLFEIHTESSRLQYSGKIKSRTAFSLQCAFTTIFITYICMKLFS